METPEARLAREAAVSTEDPRTVVPDSAERVAEKLERSLETARQYADDYRSPKIVSASECEEYAQSHRESSPQSTGVISKEKEQESGAEQQSEGFVPFASQRKVGPDEKIFRVCDHLYVGSEYGAADVALLLGLRISRVINITSGERTVPNFGASIEGFEYVNFYVPDFVGADLRQAMVESSSLISRWAEEGKVALVHCSAGLSRSAAVVMCWLMKAKGQSLKESVDTFMRTRGRPPACNPSFWTYLWEFEREAIKSEDLAGGETVIVSPSFDFSDWVVDDLGVMGFGPPEEVRRRLKEKQWDAYAVFESFLQADA
uniref:protein-tyrosine-phosphatase n=1 Tax=Chromera velia CCMP2878 TaxID=1169474 RepID=A0A0G4I702_9ALVE|eukprot:Cvel_11472.t1-p1 / transcript=Cvel_11472.t1 / gene=Cvel_11472 / organism=Chromera_velia_CCMP2878 / gene_product=Protein phosphatase Slingshot homolog 2, putative / transcript_product=Protein phosphatase Slingshot homolog 2, putative / location=Cvel_scaffold722:38357-39301(-) / protein_length=315 / sequence_SO=supercontig / SO=protein_coding / is_pseudo=false